MINPADEMQLRSYEQLPYESHPFFESHPGRLATIAHLAGLNPPPLEHCRVLELGCASAGNLIPAAEVLPGASFLGIDLIANQIADGREVIAALGLANIRLETMNLTDLTPDAGPFDYIIAHGLFSWVPREMQTRIMAICESLLSPHGIAYISYNTNPGWRIRSVMREMLFYGAGEITGESVRSRLDAARSFSEEILAAAGDHESDYTRLLRAEIDLVRNSADAYLVHDHMEQFQEPVYFHEFAAMAATHGLAYVSDSKFNKAIYRIEARLRERDPELERNNWVRFEQSVDFAYGRQFRRSVLCRAGQIVRRAFDSARLTDCYLGASVFPKCPVDPRPGEAVTFENPDDGGTFITAEAGLKAALAILAGCYPLTMGYEQLWEQVRQVIRLPRNHAARDAMAEPLLTLFLGDSLEPHLMPPAFVTHVSERPIASPLARLQAARGHVIHNRQHRAVRSLGDLDRAVLRLLDGTRDFRQIVNAVASPGMDSDAMETPVRESFQRLALAAVLIA